MFTGKRMGLRTDTHFVGVSIVHYGGDADGAGAISQCCGAALAHGRHQGIGGAQIDTYRALLLMRNGGLPGLSDL